MSLSTYTPLILAVAVPLLYALGLCIYRVYFHPLADYPGPVLAKVTSAYAAYHGWKGDIPSNMYECHQKYGERIRYGPNTVLFNSATGHQDIYGHGANVVKTLQYTALAHRTPSIMTLRDKEAHGIRRRLISQTLSESAIKQHEPAILESVKKLCDNLTSGASTAKNVTEWTDYLFFDIMSKVAFGLSFNLLGDATYRYLPKAIQDSNRRLSVLVWNTALKTLRCDKWVFPDALKGKIQFILFIQEVVKRALSPVEGKPGGQATTTTTSIINRKSVFSNLQNAKDPETGSILTTRQLSAECAVLIVAGSDTSSTALVETLFYLTRYPHALTKCIAEIRTAFPTADDVHLGPTLSSCRYLRACIDEAMRLSPPVGGALLREVGKGGMMIDNTPVPAGTYVGTGIYSLHHHADYFSNPFTYRPERFLQSPLTSSSSPPPLLTRKSTLSNTSPAPTLVPFSIGPRSCVGRGLAIAEIMLCLSYMFSRLDFSSSFSSTSNHATFCETDVVERGVPGVSEFDLREWITSVKGELRIGFRERVVCQ